MMIGRKISIRLGNFRWIFGLTANGQCKEQNFYLYLFVCFSGNDFCLLFSLIRLAFAVSSSFILNDDRVKSPLSYISLLSLGIRILYGTMTAVNLWNEHQTKVVDFRLNF